MKKIFLFISPLIAFFLGGILFPIYSKAAVVPKPQTFTVMENTVEELFNFGFVPQSLQSYGNINTNAWDPWQIGGALLNFDLEDCEITELTQTQKNDLLNSWSIIDNSNVNITTNDSIYSVKMDNGFFTGYCYVDSQGNLLSFTNDLGGQLLQAKFGGSIKSSEDWENLYQSTATQIYESNMMLYNHPEMVSDVGFYMLCAVNDTVCELYIPNQYEKGKIVPVTTTNGEVITSWYCNGTPYQFRIVYGTNPSSPLLNVQSGTFSKDGVSYTTMISRRWWAIEVTPNNTYSNWINGVNPNNRIFAVQGQKYSSSTYNAVASDSQSVAFKPLQIPEGSEIINYNYYYDPTSISRLEQRLNDLTQSINQNFNNQQNISENNFPFYYPVINVQNEPSEIPFPNVENYPGFDTLPNGNIMPDPATAPSIGSDIGEVDPTELRSTIPVINNLLNRFPFSIPWDIYGLLSGLSVQRETPYINTTIHIPGINYDWVLDYDLAEFDGIASLFRTLFLIAFILGLAYFSYDHFFGS